MSLPTLLLSILFLLMAIIGGQRGVKSFFILLLNFILLFIMVILIGVKLNPIKVTVAISTLITSVTLFFINGVNKKTIASLMSVFLVVSLTIIIVYIIGIRSQIQGFGPEQAESLTGLSVYVGVDFTKIVICEAIIGLLGAITDVSISIASSLNEIYVNNSFLNKWSLMKSGVNIGRDILGTMTNTLLFAYISEFMTLIIHFMDLNYSIFDVLNKKVFCAEIFQVLLSGIGVILIIPVTSFIVSNILILKYPNFKNSKA